MDTENTTAYVAATLRSLYEADEGRVEKILVRSVSETLYAVQLWRLGDAEPEGFFVNLEDIPAISAE
jgi:hypothetical protein